MLTIWKRNGYFFAKTEFDVMRLNRSNHCIGALCLLIGLSLFHGCTQAPVMRPTDSQIQIGALSEPNMPTAARQYAGEVLAYMMRVTFGKAGAPNLRGTWSSRGVDLPMDFRSISDLIKGADKQPSRVMVLDNNILGLSQVLYHYDPRLNLLKGQNDQVSLFPSRELIAIRVMLLQKMSRGEKVAMGALMQKKAQILDPHTPAENIDLANTGLTPPEMKLLKEAIQSDPGFMTYLEHPHIIETLYRMGAVRMGPYVQAKIQKATYADISGAHACGGEPVKTVTITMLPSISKAFETQGIESDHNPSGFKADETYLAATQNLKKALIQFLQKLIGAKMFADKDSSGAVDDEAHQQQVNAFVDEHVDIIEMNQRPLVVHPENAEKVLKQICANADFNIIILGTNVYLSMHISDVDTFPHANRVYLDIAAVRHEQVDYEISQISRFVFTKLKSHIPSQSATID